MVFCSRGLLVVSRDIFCCHNWKGCYWHLMSKGQGCFFYLFVYLLILFLAVGMVVPGLFSAVCGLSLVVEHGTSLLL